jgi:hypothetical protein
MFDVFTEAARGCIRQEVLVKGVALQDREDVSSFLPWKSMAQQPAP